jgi:hypothetical protein
MVFIRHQRGGFIVYICVTEKYKGLMVKSKTVDTGNAGKGIELVLNMIGILIPGLEVARYVFGIDITQQNRRDGFVFNDNNSKGFNRHILGNLLPDNTTSSLFTPSCRASVLS